MKRTYSEDTFDRELGVVVCVTRTRGTRGSNGASFLVTNINVEQSLRVWDGSCYTTVKPSGQRSVHSRNPDAKIDVEKMPLQRFYVDRIGGYICDRRDDCSVATIYEPDLEEAIPGCDLNRVLKGILQVILDEHHIVNGDVVPEPTN